MRQPYWMWYPGDYEIHHALKLNLRREERGYIRPAFWRLDDCWHNVRFRLNVTLSACETVTAYCTGVGNFTVDDHHYPYGEAVSLAPGQHQLVLFAAKHDGLPSVYVEGETVCSGPDWQADNFCGIQGRWLPVGTSEDHRALLSPPETFPFSYDTILPVTAEATEAGTLYDFGKETFARLRFTNVAKGPAVPVYFGESREEALSVAGAYLCDTIADTDADFEMPSRAFRYVHIFATERAYHLDAQLEYLPLPFKGSFACSDERMNRVWNTAAYTFHLNSREFFLDGLKRDRWIWSGDAFQSYLIDYYLFFNESIIRRTSTALRGKDPVQLHINTIVDYSLYWVIALGDYYRFTGDGDYIRFIWPRLVTLINFCLQALNDDGFLVGTSNDWTFIDWHSPMDKEGAVCAVQMLLIKALETAGKCAELVREDSEPYRRQEALLRQRVDSYYWCPEKGAYIDSYSSGRKNVTRHANLFAVLFGIADGEKKRSIVDRVLNSDSVPPITTPYFKFFELEALCVNGNYAQAYAAMEAYWGGMIDLDATTIWEEYNPEASGLDHYSMFGPGNFAKSLCHAWGASPIYLLGRYFLGVSPTSDGYETFICEPQPVHLQWMTGTVPIKNGYVQVEYRNGTIRVTASRGGGTLLHHGTRIPLQAGQPAEIRLVSETQGAATSAAPSGIR